MALIDRDALIGLIMDADSILNECLPIGEYEPIGEALSTAIDTIRNAKPVVHGKWIEVLAYKGESTYSGVLIHKCSNCGHKKSKALHWAYCPDCGADMRGANNAE